jgi:predicted dehydrogenase
MNKSNIWLIGTGLMAVEYAKVLKDLNCNIIAIGRGEENCKNFYEQTNIKTISGGLENFLATNPAMPEAVINAVGIESLSSSTILLLDFGIKYMLLEKPGFGYPTELAASVLKANLNNAQIYLAYNRRFYQSTIKALKLIEEDGGVKSFNFEFTEWAHSIALLPKHKAEHENWLYGNSSHLIDLAFYLGGKPKEISAYKSGHLDWHPSGSKYAGAGISSSNALFSYIANWESPGRWNLEICTENLRLIFKPIEKLQIMKKGSVAIEFVEDINYDIDEKYKPGLFLQVQNFLNNDVQNLKSLSECAADLEKIYSVITK